MGMKLKYNQSGIAHFVLVIAVVIIGVIGFAGWKVWDSKNDDSSSSRDTKNNTSQENKTESSSNSSELTDYVNVIQEDGSIIQVTPKKIAKTDDQAKILEVLHGMCKDTKNSYVVISSVVFDGNANFMQDGNYATINASRCYPIAFKLEDLGGSGSATYLHKDADGKWIFDTSSQMAVACEEVDGKGYPQTILASCGEDTASGYKTRAPK